MSETVEKGMANHLSILALRTSWTVWKGYQPYHYPKLARFPGSHGPPKQKRIRPPHSRKWGLCLFFEEACCFYSNKSGVVKEAARNLTNRAWRTHQHLSNSWENWLSNWNWMSWVLSFLGPLLLLTLILTFSSCLMHLSFKISSGSLTSLHQLPYPQATSNSLRLSKTWTPPKSPWPTFQPFLISPL